VESLERFGSSKMQRLIGWLVVCSGCAAERPPDAPRPPAAAPTSAPAESAVTPASPEPAPAPEEPAASPAPRRFPPAEIAPPHPRSAQPGDGQWAPLGSASAGDRAAEGEPVMVRTVVRPHPISKWISVTVVAIDLERSSLHLVAGTEEPKSMSGPGPAEIRTGLVAAEHQETVLAVMNGGWKTAHGRWGMMVNGHVFVPPRPEGCTIALGKDGSVRIGAWPKLEPSASELAAYRQTPPCLVEDGALHELLRAGQERPWGGMDPKEKTRRRSALGVDASGKLLFYGFGDEASAKLLAEGMRIAGAAQAAELDINYSWTRFLLIGRPRPDAPLQTTSTLVPQMVHQKTGYVSAPAPRDFFYLTRSAQSSK
jgi:hypothetical protein